MKNNNTYKDFIRQENELTKLKIQAEFGIELEHDSKLNPAVENIWLNQILEYERAMKDNRQITIGEYLDQPACKPVDELTDAEISEELQKIMELMQSRHLVIDSICSVEDREMYRFITQELFAVKTDSNLPKNMIVCYIYEEFHPNDEYDLKNFTQEFLEGLTKKDFDPGRGFANKKGEEEKIRIDKLVRRINLFRNAFEKIEVASLEFSSLNIHENTAEINIDYTLDVYPSAGIKHEISGNGKISFLKEFELWFIDDVDMKGIC
jgi:hypothetical protein